MCDEEKMPGFWARQSMYAKGDAMLRKDQRAAQQEPAAQQPRPGFTAKAETALVVVGAVVLLAGMHAILHAALIAVIAVAGLALLGTGVLVGWRVRRHSVAMGLLTAARAEEMAAVARQEIAAAQARRHAVAAPRVVRGEVVEVRRERLPRGG